MDILAKFRDMAKKKRRVIVLPESEDERILNAAAEVHKEEIASPILPGDAGKVQQSAEKLKIKIADIPVINPDEYQNLRDLPDLLPLSHAAPAWKMSLMLLQ